MTKSIEAQAEEYAGKRYDKYLGTHISESWSITKANYLAGAKARDAQWSAVVNELREALKFYADKNNWLRDAKGWRHDMIIKDLDDESLNDWEGRFSGKISRQSLIKADQMLKEMGINL